MVIMFGYEYFLRLYGTSQKGALHIPCILVPLHVHDRVFITVGFIAVRAEICGMTTDKFGVEWNVRC